LQLEPRDQQSLEHAHEDGGQQRYHDTDPQWVAEATGFAGRHSRDDHAGQADHRANRQVDAAGDDDERDTNRENPEHGYLTRRVHDVRGAQEVRVRGPERDAHEHQRQQHSQLTPHDGDTLPSPVASSLPVINPAIASCVSS
jgi:hypothetical protein